MKKTIFDKDNPKGVVVDYTAEDLTQHEKDTATEEKRIADETEAKTQRENLKASAKAKLIAGEPLTEEEADTIVI